MEKLGIKTYFFKTLGIVFLRIQDTVSIYMRKRIKIECKMYLDEAVEIAEEKNNIAKYADFLIKRYEEVYEEKRKLEWQNERLREQVEFFERSFRERKLRKRKNNLKG